MTKKTVLHRSLAVLLSTLVAEMALRLYPDTRKRLVYSSAYREHGLGPGGYLKEGFVGYVEDGLGGTGALGKQLPGL